MAVIVKSSIKITKGFDTWQKMVKSQDEKLKELGIKFIFAGTEKDDPNQLHAIMMFPRIALYQSTFFLFQKFQLQFHITLHL